MNIAAIIAEYNPFHNGHAYHIEQTRRAGATHIVAIMSGSVVQRGDFAVVDKFVRAEAAVRCGADLVLELPAPFACAAANRFAFGAVSLAAGLGCADILSFGCECGDLRQLQRAAECMYSPSTAQRIKELVSQGIGYPQAAAQVVSEAGGAPLSGPNDLLAAEYLCAMQRLGFEAQPLAVQRFGAAHDGGSAEGGFADAAFLRSRLLAGEDISEYMPQESAALVQRERQNGKIGGGLAAVSQAVLYRLRTMTPAEYELLPDAQNGLADRLRLAASRCEDLELLLKHAAAKQYSTARLRRTVMAALLGIDRTHYAAVPYARVLACNTRGVQILRRVSQTMPVSHSPAKLAQSGTQAKALLECERRAYAVFCLTQSEPSQPRQEFTRKFTVENARPI